MKNFATQVTAQGGILDAVDSLSADAVNTLTTVSIVVGIGFVLLKWWQGKTITALLIAALTVGLGLWVVNNITKVSDGVGNEIDLGAPVITHTIDVSRE